MRALILIAIAPLVADNVRADYTLPPGRLREACVLIDFANTDAALSGDWHNDAGMFLLKHCRNEAGALAAFEKACEAFNESNDPYPTACAKAAKLKRKLEAQP